jgi:hypothetical protein
MAEITASTTVPSTTSSQAQKKPYQGSCHCGDTKYVVWARMEPLDHIINKYEQKIPENNVRVYKCNCTICHKRGHFHVRLPSPAVDFALLSPLDPFAELGDYRCNGGRQSWFFCKKCGTSCICFAGDSEVITRTDIPGQEGKEVKVWAPAKATFSENVKGKTDHDYLSINAHTLEPNQQGFDLREWSEKKRVSFLDCLNHLEETNFDRPAEGGTY